MTRTAFASATSLLLALALGATPAAAQQAGAKLAYVNSRTILEAAPGFAKAESTYTKEVQGYQDEVAKLQATLDSAAADFEQQSVLLSPTAKASKRKDLESQRDKLEARANELRDRASQRERELLDPINTRVTAVIEGMRAEGNYAMIFDVSASSGLIVAADKSLDLTDKVIQRLKSSH